MPDSLRPHGLQHTRPPCPSPSPRLRRLMPTESVMPSNHLVLSPLLLPPSIFPGMSVCVLVAQSCPTLCDPMDCSLPGSFVHGILQARVLEWAAISFSRSASGSFLMSRLFASGGQRIGASASATVLPVNIQGWFPLGGTGWSKAVSSSGKWFKPPRGVCLSLSACSRFL